MELNVQWKHSAAILLFDAIIEYFCNSSDVDARNQFFVWAPNSSRAWWWQVVACRAGGVLQKQATHFLLIFQSSNHRIALDNEEDDVNSASSEPDNGTPPHRPPLETSDLTAADSDKDEDTALWTNADSETDLKAYF